MENLLVIQLFIWEDKTKPSMVSRVLKVEKSTQLGI